MIRSPANDNADARFAAACPLCGAARAPEHRPFCSARCADIDLHRWLNGSYVVAGRDEGVDHEPSAPVSSGGSNETGLET
jgi:uncharacterized protein